MGKNLSSNLEAIMLYYILKHSDGKYSALMLVFRVNITIKFLNGDENCFQMSDGLFCWASKSIDLKKKMLFYF